VVLCYYHERNSNYCHLRDQLGHSRVELGSSQEAVADARVWKPNERLSYYKYRLKESIYLHTLISTCFKNEINLLF
jgi:hypothetical protein